jgi:hypothetical protein
VNADWLRLANAVLAMIDVALILAGSIAHWHLMPRRVKQIAPWVTALLLVVAYGSGEAAHQDTPSGIRVALMACVLLGLMVALLYRIGDDDYSE